MDLSHLECQQEHVPPQASRHLRCWLHVTGLSGWVPEKRDARVEFRLAKNRVAHVTCPACGKNNFKWAKRCDHCKAPLTGEARPEATTAASSEKQTTAASWEKLSPVLSGCGVEHLEPAEREAQVQAVTDRVKSLLASGLKPEWIFLCQMGNGGTLCLPPVNGRTSLLLFTSPILALDYLRAIGEHGKVGGVQFNSITELSRGWPPELAVGSACLNRCPRCPVGLAFPLDALESLDSFLKIWALERASRFLQGQAYARVVFENQKKGLAEMKLPLEALRDHGGADNAHVHQLLAMIAQSQQDAKGRAAALERLKEFQLPVKLETDDFARGFSEGIVGLMATYELLRVPNSPAQRPGQV